MNPKVEQAVENMRGSYSCSQAVMCAFHEDAGVSHDEARRIAAPYAGGAKIKCGAICAAELVLTAKYGDNDAPKLHASFEQKFLNKVGAINCREIRSRGLRPCIGCVQDAAVILDEMLTH